MWDGANIVVDITGSGVVQYVRGIGLIAARSGGVWTYYLFNARGDVVQLTNAGGVVVRTYRYDAFGVEQNPDEGDTNPWRFTGEYFDRETGTVYLRFRHYNPRLGRFTQEDPYWGVHNMMDDILTIKQSINLYVYTVNNPVRWIDPTGMVIQTAMDAAGRETILNYLQMLTRDALSWTAIEGDRWHLTVRQVSGNHLQHGTDLIRRMVTNAITVNIVLSTIGVNSFRHNNPGNSFTVGGGGTIFFNPSADLGNRPFIDPDTGLAVRGSTTPYFILAHELIHADRAMRGATIRRREVNYTYRIAVERYFIRRTWSWSSSMRVTERITREDLATIGLRFVEPGDITENMIRAEHGAWLRGGYLWPR